MIIINVKGMGGIVVILIILRSVIQCIRLILVLF